MLDLTISTHPHLSWHTSIYECSNNTRSDTVRKQDECWENLVPFPIFISLCEFSITVTFFAKLASHSLRFSLVTRSCSMRADDRRKKKNAKLRPNTVMSVDRASGALSFPLVRYISFVFVWACGFDYRMRCAWYLYNGLCVGYAILLAI